MTYAILYQEHVTVVVVVVIVVALPKVSLSFCSFNDLAVCSASKPNIRSCDTGQLTLHFNIRQLALK